MSCEADLQELLHQIDIMVSHRRREWEGQNQELRTRLQATETQLIHSRMQVGNLQRQVEETERVQRETVRGFEDRLGSLHSELEKLKDSYGRLRGHLRREEVQAAQEDSSFESITLSIKLEELRMKSREWEKQRSLHQKDLAALEVNRKLLAAKCQLFQQLKSGCYQSPLAGEQRVEMQNEATELQTQLEAAHKVAQVNEVTAGQLREVQTSQRETCVEECFLPEVLALQQESQDDVCKLRAELQARDDLLQATQLEVKHWKREASRLRERLSAQEFTTRLEVEEKERMMAAELQDLSENVERVQRQLETSIQQEGLLREDITQLQIGLESSNSHTKQLRDALDKNEEKLHDLEHSGKCKDNKIVMLKEKLVQQQAERSEMEAIRAETLHLRAQLRDSENTVASANHRAAQLQRELLSITGKATEYQVAKIQLEALRLENKKLKQLISEMESNTSLILSPLGDHLAGDVICDVSSDSGQWEEECQTGEASCSTEDPYNISHVSPQPASWEQTEATGYPPAQSPTPKPEDCYYPHGNSHREEDFTTKVDRTKNVSALLETSVLKSPRPVFTIGEQFLQEEEQMMKRLERNFDSYIQELHSDTQRALQKYGICQPEDGASS
ncbi:centrosomal protein of 63 kDa-like [Anguilla anguilla]|uniref:centrosomal protein of 63 kDa-like n=1 Tax=Anguilla anguilla TaxID=7936 RepID=UPI0015AE60B3|nr:centrosomal protein of 63 kDa-like [Anguilla anguilla]